MAGFRELISSTCWLVTALATFYFWVVILSTFGASQYENESFPDNCKPDEIRRTMQIWMRWMTVSVVGAVSILFHVRRKVDAAAAAESKGNSFQEGLYKLAQDELKEAFKAVDDALAQSTVDSRDDYIKKIGERNVAKAKVARNKPKEGMESLPLGMQRRFRVQYFLAIICSFGAGVCASVAFYQSLRLFVRCHDNAGTVGPHVGLGIVFLYVHFAAAWDGFTVN